LIPLNRLERIGKNLKQSEKIYDNERKYY
jgi:hypothetical protein